MSNSEIVIRKSTPEEIVDIVELWHEVSLAAHDFISPEFWESNKSRMATEYLPAADTLVAVLGNEILAFISLVDDHVAALFVSTSMQGRGVGSLLLAEVKKNRSNLNLKVYKKNRKSREFYHKHGFKTASEELDPESGEREFLMEWKFSVH